MAVDEIKMQQAKNVYETICRMLDNRNWHYQRHDDELTITFGVRGDDLPMDMVIKVRPEIQVVSIFSPMQFKVAEDKRVEGALAVAVANYGMINGSFDYDLSDGEIRFRAATSYRESLLSEDLFSYLVNITTSTVDKYNDKFLMVSNGMMTVQKFIEWENSSR